MGYCLSCGKLRDTIGGWCQQCREDDQLRKHPGWKPRCVVLEEQRREQAKQERESLI